MLNVWLSIVLIPNKNSCKGLIERKSPYILIGLGKNKENKIQNGISISSNGCKSKTKSFEFYVVECDIRPVFRTFLVSYIENNFIFVKI